MGTYGVAVPKPKRKVSAATKRRREQRILTRVRNLVQDRDGHCRFGRWGQDVFAGVFGLCDGVSELAHLGDSRRFKTRGQAPEIRHQTAGALMLCTRHHRMLDAHEIAIEELTERRADGPLQFTKGITYLGNYIHDSRAVR